MNFGRVVEVVLPLGLGTTAFLFILVILGFLSLLLAIYLSGVVFQACGLVLSHANKHPRKSRKFRPTYIG